LDEKTRVLLFFPGACDVLIEILPYFKELAEVSQNFHLDVFDLAMEPQLAQEYKVAKQGTVIIVRGGNHQKIEVGDKWERAKTKLRNLDEEVQKALLKLSYEREVVYLITGHGERTTQQLEGDRRAQIRMLQKLLEAKNFTVKRLSSAQGLSNSVPDDAALLIWAGPTYALFPGELDALQAYLDRGGRALILLDQEGGDKAADLLDYLGLDFYPTKLAHARWFVVFSHTRADCYNLVTNKFSSHAASNVVSRYSNDLPVALPTVGYLKRSPKSNHKEEQVNFIVRTLPNTWADIDGDFEHGANEPSRVFELGAAVTRKTSAQNRKVDERASPLTREDKTSQSVFTDEMRVAVFADADMFADVFLPFRGNRFLLADVLKWLLGDQRAGGVVSREQDVAVAHTHKDDVVWFYLSVFVVPVIILILGLGTRWGRGRRWRMSR
jgi:hypothetical protein